MKIVLIGAMALCFNNLFMIPMAEANQNEQAEIGTMAESLPDKVPKEGVVKTYYQDGSLWEEFINKDGRRHGKYREYDPKGILKREVDYENGEIKEIRNYDENRQLVVKIMQETIGEENSNVEKSTLMALHRCVSEETGVRFACNPHWKLSRQGKTIAITVSLIPEVKIVIEESDSKMKFLSDFSRPAITSLGRFEEGFDITRIENCGRETVRVDGYLKGNPNAKVLDLFMIDHNNLHSVQFDVNPKEVWRDYEDLIKKVIDSMEFAGYKSRIKFNLNPTDENCEELVK